MQAWRLLSQFSFCRISSSATTKSFIMMIIQHAEINRVCGGKHPTILLSLSLRNRKLWFTQTAVNTHQEYSHMHTHTWVCRLCFPCNTTTNIVWIVGCGMPQGFSKLMSSLSLSLSVPLYHYISHPAAGTCGCLHTVAATQSRSSQCLIPVCILSATPQTSAAPLELACYAATHTHIKGD